MTTALQHNVPVFFVNSVSISGTLTKGEAGDITTFFVTGFKGQYTIFLETANEYLAKIYDETEDNSWVEVEACIVQFPNGHFLFAQGFNTPSASISGTCIRVNEPKQVNERTVINFAIAQSVNKDEPGTIIDCAYWYKASDNGKQNITVAKLKVGAFLAVSGSLKVGSYTKDGMEIPTISVDARHIGAPKASSASNGVMPITKPNFGGKPMGKPAVTPTPVATPVAGGPIEF